MTCAEQSKEKNYASLGLFRRKSKTPVPESQSRDSLITVFTSHSDGARNKRLSQASHLQLRKRDSKATSSSSGEIPQIKGIINTHARATFKFNMLIPCFWP